MDFMVEIEFFEANGDNGRIELKRKFEKGLYKKVVLTFNLSLQFGAGNVGNQ